MILKNRHAICDRNDNGGSTENPFIAKRDGKLDGEQTEDYIKKRIGI